MVHISHCTDWYIGKREECVVLAGALSCSEWLLSPFLFPLIASDAHCVIGAPTGGPRLQLPVCAQVISLPNQPQLYEGRGFRKKVITRTRCLELWWASFVEPAGCELEYFTQIGISQIGIFHTDRFLASSALRDSNHLTNHPQALPLSPAFPHSAAIHDLSYIFSLSC